MATDFQRFVVLYRTEGIDETLEWERCDSVIEAQAICDRIVGTDKWSETTVTAAWIVDLNG